MKKEQWVLCLVIGLCSPSAFAKNDFTEMSDCGSAKVVSGDTCSNVKVEFDFKNCAYKSGPQVAKRIICDGTKIKARFQEGDYRYEARFDKQEDGWGGVQWQSLGGMQQWRKKKVALVVESVPERSPAAYIPSPQTPAPAAIVGARAPAAEPSALKFSAFVDARYTAFNAEGNRTVADAHAESGFGIEDGAFFVNYDKDRVSFVADIAIRRGKDSDTKDAPAVPNQSSNNNLGIGVDRSQLYIRYRAMDGLVFDLGQFDTIYGVELNDSKDRVFGKTGIVYDGLLPVTHTGLKIEWSMNGAYVKALAANPNNKGSYGTSASGDNNTEYGAAVGYANDWIRGQAGYMTRPINKADGVGRGNRALMDFIVGTTIDRFSLDVEYGIVQDPSKNTLTAANTDDEDGGTGLMVLASYKITDELLAGVRWEKVENDPLAVSLKTVDSYGAAVHYKLTSELELRTEYIAYTNKNVAGVDWNDNRFAIGGLLAF